MSKTVNNDVSKDPPIGKIHPFGVGGGTPLNFWWGCAARNSKSRPKCHFPCPFSDLALYVIKHSIRISAERKSTLQR